MQGLQEVLTVPKASMQVSSARLRVLEDGLQGLYETLSMLEHVLQPV